MNIDKVVSIGTSHTLPKFNPMQSIFSEKYNIDFENHAVSSLGIDSYFSRMHMILENNPGKKLFFIAEIPCGGRYQEFYHNNNKEYNKWETQNKDFWGIHGEYCTLEGGTYPNFITYFNVSKLFNDKKTLVDKTTTKALLKVKTLSDRRMEDENIISQVLALNGFAKSQGHKISWFSFNNHMIEELEVKQYFINYGVDLVTKYVLEDVICEKYNYSDTIEIKKNKDIYPDGSHLTRQDWKFLIEKFFLELI